MAEMNFSGSGTARTRRYSVNLASPGHLDTPFLPDFVLNEAFNGNSVTATSYPTFKYNDPGFNNEGITLILTERN
jgi:hypothetical protein